MTDNPEKLPLLELLESASSTTCAVHVVGEPDRVSYAALWSKAERASGWFGANAIDSVALHLDSSTDALACLIGGWIAGATVASLPGKSPSESAEHYRTRLRGMCELVHTQCLISSPKLGHLVDIPSFRPSTLVASARRPVQRNGGSFVQFTSGTTGEPKGVRLSLPAIASNILGTIQARGHDRVHTCTFLPLSHDMGLFGMALAPWVAASPHVCGHGGMDLLPTDAFMRSPGRWVSLCSSSGADTTAAPDSVFDLISQRTPAPEWQLAGMRTMISGSERVRASTLRSIEATLQPIGLRTSAICPAYGLAEAVLAVTMVRPGGSWRSLRLDPVKLGQGQMAASTDGAALEVVSTGAPISGVEVRIRSPHAGEVGEILLRGRNLFSGYVGDMDLDGWHRTGDVGFLDDGELFVLGRHEELLPVGPSALPVLALETALQNAYDVRGARCAVAAAPAGDGYTVALEGRKGTSSTVQRPTVLDLLTEIAGSPPLAVVQVGRGELPRTPSGKVDRATLQSLMNAALRKD